MKKVIIADAGSSFGKKITEKFLKEGWKVYAGYMDKVNLPETAGDLIPFEFEAKNHPSVLALRELIGEAVDMIIVNVDKQLGDPDTTISEDIDFDSMREAYEYNTLTPLYLINASMPLLEKGELKRICVVTTKDASNNACYDTANYYNHVSRAPLNMAVTQLFNGLRPEGYSFRYYCKDTQNGNDDWAFDYFTRGRSYEPWDLKHSDEERIVLRDWQAREVPW